MRQSNSDKAAAKKTFLPFQRSSGGRGCGVVSEGVGQINYFPSRKMLSREGKLTNSGPRLIEENEPRRPINLAFLFWFRPRSLKLIDASDARFSPRSEFQSIHLVCGGRRPNERTDVATGSPSFQSTTGCLSAHAPCMDGVLKYVRQKL